MSNQGDRLTPTGDDARALRHMVRELGEAPPPQVNWERVEARLFDRIDGKGEASTQHADVDDEALQEAPVSRPSRAAGPARDRVQRRVRGRWLGAWAAVAAVLVAGAAFAWVERMGQVTPPASSAPRGGGSAAAPAHHVEGAAVAPAHAGPREGEEPGSREAPAPVLVAPKPRAASPAPAEVAPATPSEPASEPPPAAVASTVVTSERELTQRLLRCIEDRRAAERASAQREGVEAVVVEIRSQLVLRVGGEGAVEGAMFQPPLRPELQGCAVSALRAQLAPGEREVRIPIVLR